MGMQKMDRLTRRPPRVSSQNHEHVPSVAKHPPGAAATDDHLKVDQADCTQEAKELADHLSI